MLPTAPPPDGGRGTLRGGVHLDGTRGESDDARRTSERCFSVSPEGASAVARSEYKARIALCRHSITLRNAPSRYTAFTECTSFRSPLVELHTSKRLQPEAVITTERQESTGETRPDTGRQLNTSYNVTNTPTTPL